MMKKSNSHNKELERVGEEYKKLLKEIQLERIRRKIDKKIKSRKRICLGLVNLYNTNPSFKEILLNSEMPDLEEEIK
jgi:PHP family Zn ribbon phosphoesterase